MSDYDNSNRVSLWLNAKRAEQKHPHLTGKGETDYPVYASAWFSKELDPDDAKTLMGIVKRYAAKSNKPFLNITFKAQDRPNDKLKEPPTVPSGAGELDDDISF